jgi:hypothetical protein
MPDEEFRVEVDLGSDEHHLSLGERLRSLDVDDDARKRLGSRVTVTRDGNQIFLYTHTLQDALEADRTVKELVSGDHLTAEFTVTRWDPSAQEWVSMDGKPELEKEPVGIPDPTYVFLEAYKPDFLRDLGL